MQVHIMGSAAAEGWPAMWCKCDSCHRARTAGGRSIRSRSGALVDGVIKLDLCADTYMQALRDGIDLSQVTDLLVTHAHGDHLVPTDLGFTMPPYAHGFGPLHVWSGAKSIARILPATGRWEDAASRLHTLEPFEPVTLADGTYVMPLQAAHDPNSDPLNYIIQRNGKTLFYGMDSGWYPDESWAAHSGHLLDIVIMDCTNGNKSTWWGHGSVGEAIKIRERMLAEGTSHAGTQFVVNHFSHNGGLLHHELEAMLAGTGVQVGYDGMVIEA